MSPVTYAKHKYVTDVHLTKTDSTLLPQQWLLMLLMSIRRMYQNPCEKNTILLPNGKE